MAERLTYKELELRIRELEEESVGRKRAEEALLESEKRFRTLFDYAGDAIGIHDLDGHFLEVNQELCKRLGYSLEEMLQMTAMDIDTSEYSAILSERIEELHRRGHAIFETAHTRRDGSIIPTEVSSRIIEFAGKPAVLSIGRDITERKSAEEERKKFEAQLQMSQKMETIGTLAGGIAHDFNNLLMGIQGNASLMLMNIDLHYPYYEMLKSIEKQIQSGAILTNKLLGYARKGRYEVKPTNLNRVVEETSRTFGRTRKQITIHKNLAEDLFAIEADKVQIEQVLLNLFINASDAMPGGGELYLETKNVTHKDMRNELYELYKSKAGNYVKLTVRDTGKGMDEITMERIFDPFFTTKEMGRGTGLGLASVYGIIKTHGGYINVESKEKQGTTIKIYLPATDVPVKTLLSQLV